MLALGPFAMTTCGRAGGRPLPVAMWGYPLWSVRAGSQALLWFGTAAEPLQLRSASRPLG